MSGKTVNVGFDALFRSRNSSGGSALRVEQLLKERLKLFFSKTFLAGELLGNRFAVLKDGQTAGGGPKGATGLLIADESVPMDRLAVDESKQAWSARFGMSSMIGTWLDAPPTAEELLRARGISGSEVSLLDGHHWHVPILRKWSPDSIVDWTCQLPRVMQQCAESGAWLVTAVVPEYRELWDHSMRIAQSLFDQLSDRDAAELDWSDLFNFAVAVLRVNYHVDASVLSHLQVLQPDLAAEIVQAALDWPTLRASLKNALSRQASGGTNTESGATQPTKA